jgi:hypothetical protein
VRLRSGQDRTGALPKGDIREARAAAETSKNDLIAVLKSSPEFAVGKHDRLLAARGQLKKTSR